MGSGRRRVIILGVLAAAAGAAAAGANGSLPTIDLSDLPHKGADKSLGDQDSGTTSTGFSDDQPTDAEQWSQSTEIFVDEDTLAQDTLAQDTVPQGALSSEKMSTTIPAKSPAESLIKNSLAEDLSAWSEASDGSDEWTLNTASSATDGAATTAVSSTSDVEDWSSEEDLSTTTDLETSMSDSFLTFKPSGIPFTDSLFLARDTEEGAIDMMVDWFTPIWNSDHAAEEWLSLVSTKINYLYTPDCSKAGYINFLYRSSSFEMRQSLRRFVSLRLAQDVKFDSPNEPMLKWLKRNFVIPFQAESAAKSSSSPELIKIYFPIGRPCTEDSKACARKLRALMNEAKHYKDLIIGDYPDASETQGVKFMTALEWLNDCRILHHSKWQWLVKFEPMIVANVPNIAYYLRTQDSDFLKLILAEKRADGGLRGGEKERSLQEDVSRSLLETLPIKSYSEKILNNVTWWGGYLMENAEVVKTPEDHPNAEANYDKLIYPPYTSKKFTILNKRVIAEFVPRYKKAGIVYRNEDSSLGILNELMNEEYKMNFKPHPIGGSVLTYTPEAIHILCGEDYKSEEDTKNFARTTVRSIIDCDCSTWLAYAPNNSTDRREVTRELPITCPFTDNYFQKKVFWQRK